MARSQTLLAFDFGEKRIGIATGDIDTKLAHALEVIEGEASAPRFARIGELIAEWKPAALIVGLPTHADGTEHELTQRARRFANQLKGRFNLPVHLVDERYTSLAADEALAGRGARAKAKQDALAAAAILQRHFDTMPR